MSQSVNNEDVLQELVNQFSDPMAFLRELIQNSIDAGTGEIEVRLEWAAGLMTIAVQDFGEGMTRQIIESKLVRLFASTKDQDLTKIGRFGIGFVSVFALTPQAVCVDTGRTGESWRVLFRADRTYELLSLKEPVEGTLVRQITRCTQEKYEEYVKRGREVLRRWCRHVSIPISYQGELINEPFELSGALVARHEEPGTRVVAALVDGEQPARASYFNRGLTLQDEAPSALPRVSYLIDSRYLEHTLTRDQILRDDHFHKAMHIAERLIERELYGALAPAIEAAAKACDWARYERLTLILLEVVRAGRLAWKGLTRAPLVRVVTGQDTPERHRLVSVGEVQKAHKKGRALVGGADSALSRSLAREGYLIVCSEAACAALSDAAALKLEPAIGAHALLEPAPREGAGPLLKALSTLGAALGLSKEVRAQVVKMERAAGEAAPLLVCAPALEQLMTREAVNAPLHQGLERGAGVLALVEDAQGADEVLGLAAAGRGALAALFAMKMALLGAGALTAQRDEVLTRAAARMMREEARG